MTSLKSGLLFEGAAQHMAGFTCPVSLKCCYFPDCSNTREVLAGSDPALQSVKYVMVTFPDLRGVVLKPDNIFI